MREPHPIFSFAVITDSHLNPEDKPNTSPWQTNRLANDRTAFAVAEINKQQPAFVVHLGDIIHPTPEDSEYGAAAATAKRVFGRLTSPFHLLPGNHDVGDKPLEWMPADCITENAVELYRGTFGADWGSFDHQDCHFVWINSSLLNSEFPHEEEQRHWLEKDLSRASGRRIFFFTHYPLYLSHQHESSHYDNIDEPGRSWLCDLLVQHSVEAVFAGHVHNFFYNRLENTQCYVLPSVTNLRQDYAELFRIEPADEYGRNDTEKLGFFMVDVFEDRHAPRFVHTLGSLAAEEGKRAGVRAIPSPVGVHARHLWAEEVELPYNGPLDELSRKRVRKGYRLVEMWGPVRRREGGGSDDLIDDRIRQRMIDLYRLKRRFTVFSFGEPSDSTIQTMKDHRNIVEQWEIVLPPNRLKGVCARLLREPAGSLPAVLYSKLRGHGAAARSSSEPFDHSVAVGFDRAEPLETALRDLSQEERGVLSGVTFKIEIDQELAPAIDEIAERARASQVKPVIFAKLSPKRSAARPAGDEEIADRVAEAVLCAWQNPKIELFLDTFQDIDRGYFLRPGLIDRRCNLRLAGHVFRELQIALHDRGSPERQDTATRHPDDSISVRVGNIERAYRLAKSAPVFADRETVST